MTTRIRAAQGKARVFEFQILASGGVAQDLSTLSACSVVVDAPDGTDKYTADCVGKAGDPTTRLVVIQGAATADRGIFSSCVHWTDAAGLPDAEPFTLEVYRHA